MKIRLYIWFISSLFFMPLMVLFFESYFRYFIWALISISLLFSILIVCYIKFNNYILNIINIIYIILINFVSNIIVCFLGGVLGSILGMALYKREFIYFFTYFSLSMIFIMSICFFIFIKPFVNHLDKSIKKIRKSKET